MKLITAILTSLMLFPTLVIAQNMVALPVDEAAKDPSFLAYRNSLLEIIHTQNTEAFLKSVAPDIHLSFGGDVGHDAMRKRLNLTADDLSEEYKSQADQMRQDYWDAIESVLRLGGRFQDGAFVAPYTWTAKLPKDADAFETYFVTGSNVLMRSSGNVDAPIITRLSYNIVFLTDWQDASDYQAIRLPDGQMGYLSTKYLRSAIDYRAAFVKLNSKWQMTVFIAGD